MMILQVARRLRSVLVVPLSAWGPQMMIMIAQAQIQLSASATSTASLPVNGKPDSEFRIRAAGASRAAAGEPFRHGLHSCTLGT